jgi:D-aminopeptidase
VFAAIDGATSGAVDGGVIGAGVGMTCYGFKGGIGTASRRAGEYTLGVLVLANFGAKEELRIDGVPVGRELGESREPGDGSCMVIVGTDAPVDARQLKRLARRGGMGLARTGSYASHGSGDFILAFSNGRGATADEELNPLFQAVVEATEEAVIDALFRAETTRGRDGHVREALPIEPTLAVMRRHNYF